MSAETRNRVLFGTSNDGLGCEICAIKFHTSAEKNDHILQHFQQIMCTICSQSLIRIGDKWYGLHEHPRTVSPKTEIPENDDNEYEPMLQPEFMAVDTEKIHLSEDHKSDDVSPFNEIDPVSNESTEMLESIKSELTVEPTERDPVDINTDTENQNTENETDNQPTIEANSTHTVKKGVGGVCTVCNKKFICRTGLKYHMNLHLGIKPYVCEQCGKAFADKRNMNEHKKVHEDVTYNVEDYETTSTKTILTKEHLKNLVCPMCNAQFKRRDGLRKHVKIHDNTRYECKACRKSFINVRNYIRHRQILHGITVESKQKDTVNIQQGDDESDASNAIDWFCEYCNDDFEYEIRLAKHILKEHSDDKEEHSCYICSEKFKSRTQLLTHVIAHPESNQFKCTFKDCAHGFAFESSLVVHTNKHNRLNKPIVRKTQDNLTETTMQHAAFNSQELNEFSCNECDKVFHQRTNLLSHIQAVHTNIRMACPAIGCSKDFKSETGRMCHVKIIHPELIMTCDICEKNFCTEGNLRKHKLSHATSEKASFSCSECDMSFLTKHRLRAHFSTHKKDVICNVCNQQFSSVKRMIQHRERHNKKSVITCRFNGCNQIFESRREFILHSSQHPSDEKKKFICSYCGKGMSSLSYLKDHINIHTGERPFECTHCGKFFAKKGSLRRHNLIHSGEKPYPCDVEGCEQKYRDSIDLKRHKFSAHKIYSKKHICPICSKVFPERKLLTKHTKTAHGKVDLAIANEITN